MKLDQSGSSPSSYPPVEAYRARDPFREGLATMAESIVL